MEQKELVRQELGRWLKHLFYVYGAGLALGLLSLVPVLEGICAVGSYVVTLLVVLVLFRLGKSEAGYRRGAVFTALAFALQLVNYAFSLMMLGQVAFTPELAVQLGLVSGAMAAGSTVLSFIGLYHVYSTHGALVPELAGKWHSLFRWTLFAGVGAAVLTAVSAALTQTWLAAATTLVYGLASFAFEILRLVLLRKTQYMLSGTSRNSPFAI